MNALDIPISPHAQCQIPSRFFNEEGTWFADKQRPDAGLHFASRYLPCLTKSRLLEEISPPLERAIARSESFAPVFAFDIWAMHADRRQALYLMRGPGLGAVFIDNGHLFGGPTWEDSYVRPRSAMERILLLNPRVEENLAQALAKMQSILPEEIDRALSGIPKGWHIGCTMTLRDKLLRRLSRLESLVWAEYDALRKGSADLTETLSASRHLMSTLYSCGEREWTAALSHSGDQ